MVLCEWYGNKDILRILCAILIKVRQSATFMYIGKFYSEIPLRVEVVKSILDRANKGRYSILL
ncbi:MAG TPA: hypothetical protein GXX58_11430 [Gelria sp.]|nr:hypothetical protein [Gelria sp.]